MLLGSLCLSWDQYTHSKLISVLCAVIVPLIHLIHNDICELSESLYAVSAPKTKKPFLPIVKKHV